MAQSSDQTMGPSYRNRCLNSGLGCQLSGDQHGTRLEKENHINYLELLVAFLALKAFTLDTHPRSILLRMGGIHSSSLSNLAIEVWKWCIARSIRIHAEHLPGKENVQADWQSHHCRDSSDWKLDEEVFAKLD